MNAVSPSPAGMKGLAALRRASQDDDEGSDEPEVVFRPTEPSAPAPAEENPGDESAPWPDGYPRAVPVEAWDAVDPRDRDEALLRMALLVRRGAEATSALRDALAGMREEEAMAGRDLDWGVLRVLEAAMPPWARGPDGRVSPDLVGWTAAVEAVAADHGPDVLEHMADVFSLMGGERHHVESFAVAVEECARARAAVLHPDAVGHPPALALRGPSGEGGRALSRR